MKSIESDSFSHNNLKKIELPDQLESIEMEAFQGNKNLKEINIPVSTLTIYKSAFLETKINTLKISKGTELYNDIDTMLFSDFELEITYQD